MKENIKPRTLETILPLGTLLYENRVVGSKMDYLDQIDFMKYHDRLCCKEITLTALAAIGLIAYL